MADALTNTDQVMPERQRLLIEKMRRVCREFDIPPHKAVEVALFLLGRDFQHWISLPEKAPVIWRDRTGMDLDRTPIEFLHHYYGSYMEAAALTQADLRRIDETLLRAIDEFCRKKGLDPLKFLPPPERHRKSRG